MDWRRFCEIPYVDGGRGWDGIDCYGLGVLINAELGTPIPDHAGVAPRSREAGQAFVAGRCAWPEVRRGEELPGDAVLIRMQGQPLHVGWIIGPGRLMHARAGAGVVMASLDAPEIVHRVLGIYRYE